MITRRAAPSNHSFGWTGLARLSRIARLASCWPAAHSAPLDDTDER